VRQIELLSIELVGKLKGN